MGNTNRPEVARHADPEAFLRVAGPFLARLEAQNNIFYGIVGDAIGGRYTGDNLWLTAHVAGVVRGVALQTPPWEFAVASGSDDEVCDALVREALRQRPEGLTGLRIPPEYVDAASSAMGRQLTLAEGQGIYELTDVIPLTGVRGVMRPASAEDLDVVVRFARGFADETEAVRSTTAELEARVGVVLASGAFVLWEVDGVVVSMAAARGPTPNGIRISWVYTPREHRGCGYASAVVAALSQRELDAGRTFCFLFTDLANPTSNKIYQNIGYRRVGELGIYR